MPQPCTRTLSQGSKVVPRATCRGITCTQHTYSCVHICKSFWPNWACIHRAVQQRPPQTAMRSNIQILPRSVVHTPSRCNQAVRTGLPLSPVPLASCWRTLATARVNGKQCCILGRSSAFRQPCTEEPRALSPSSWHFFQVYRSRIGLSAARVLYLILAEPPDWTCDVVVCRRGVSGTWRRGFGPACHLLSEQSARQTQVHTLGPICKGLD